TAAAAAILLATAAVADARPTVNLGTAKVNGCDPNAQLKGCAVKKVWFENTTSRRFSFNLIILFNADVYGFGPGDPFTTGGTCLPDFFIAPHGSCYLRIVASPAQVGANPGEVQFLRINSDRVLRDARLLVTGVRAGGTASPAQQPVRRLVLQRHSESLP